MTTENEVMLEFGYAVVFVSDMKRSIEFYRDVLGLPLRFESQEWTEFDTPGTTLALHHTDAPSTADEHKDENPAGQCHPSFTVDDIDAYHERLTSKGVTCLQPPKEEEYGRKLAKYVDPDGLPFTLSQPLEDYGSKEETEIDEPHVMLSTDGKGNWWRREWKRQCPEKVFILDRCQGVEGHEGDHWCFKKDGSFAWSRDKDHPEYKHAASGFTPPDHKDYRTPLEMQQQYYMSHYTDSEVTDPDKIARLEREETRDGESINRPCTPEEIEELGLDDLKKT
jgi:lactoylglutathione lyase